MAFIEAYDTKSGKKLPYLVPERHIDHPVLGKRLSRLPSAKRAARQRPATTPRSRRLRRTEIPVTTKTPALGDDQKKE